MLLETIVSALVPIGAEAIKAGAAKLFGGVKPLTIDDQIKLDNNEIERLKTVAALDNPGGTPSQWVIDLRASARYIAAGLIILAGIGSLFIPNLDATIQTISLEGANLAFGFLFGSRIVSSWKR